MKQLEKYLAEIGVTYSIRYDRYDFHFVGDNSKRDIYEVKLRRGRRSWSFKFGDSVWNSRKGMPPKILNVFGAVQWHDVGDFENFCWEFAYEQTRDARLVYKKVVHEYSKLTKFFSPEEVEHIVDIIHNY